MLRPRWIGALLLALLVAAGFAWLGRWQLERAVESNTSATSASEIVKPLTSVAKPGGGIRDDVTGQRVTVTGSFTTSDYQLVSDRLNKGTAGYWVVGHFTLAQPDAAGKPVALAVARGWAATRGAAEAAVHTLAEAGPHEAGPAEAGPPAAGSRAVTVTGRLLPTEAPVLPDPKADPRTMTALSVAALVNIWSDIDTATVYEAYVVQRGAPAGLVAIDSPPPIAQTTVNWLNIFYAIEWVVFAGFAVFMWYRLVKDAWERALEEAVELEGSRNGPVAELAEASSEGPSARSHTEEP